MAVKTFKNPVFDKLAFVLKGKCVILGMGNLLRGDDALGSLLAQNLKDKIYFPVIDAGIAPENFSGVIEKEKPETVLLIDCVDFGASSGEISILNSDEIKTKNFFLTHNLTPALFIDFLKKNTEAEIYLLAIQPKTISLTESLSPEINECFEGLSAWFLNMFKK